jgi:hypothetical protein
MKQDYGCLRIELPTLHALEAKPLESLRVKHEEQCKGIMKGAVVGSPSIWSTLNFLFFLFFLSFFFFLVFVSFKFVLLVDAKVFYNNIFVTNMQVPNITCMLFIFYASR